MHTRNLSSKIDPGAQKCRVLKEFSLIEIAVSFFLQSMMEVYHNNFKTALIGTNYLSGAALSDFIRTKLQIIIRYTSIDWKKNDRRLPERPFQDQVNRGQVIKKD